MMDIESEILDRELDAIFKDCSRDSLETAQVQSLIDACVERYADGQPEIKNILLQRMDPHRTNPFISRSVFKRRVKEWMLAASGDQCDTFNTLINSEDNPDNFSTSTEYIHSMACSTPLRTSPRHIRSARLPFHLINDSEYDSGSSAQDCHSLRQELSVLKDRNDSLESSLSKAEQKVYSLEMKVLKQDSTHKKQVRCLESEIHRLNSLLTEAQENCSLLQEKCDQLNNEKQVKINNERLAECERLKEIEKNKEDLEIKLLHAKEEISKKNSDLRNMESLLYRVKVELSETIDSKDAVEKELAILKIEMQSMLINEKELSNRIATLQCEKQELRNELSEGGLFESLNLSNSLQIMGVDEQPGYYPHKEDHRESGISIKSELSDVSGFSPPNYQRIASLNSLNNIVNDKSSCVLSLLTSSRAYAEEGSDISKTLRVITDEKDTQTVHICTAEIGVQALSNKPRIDSKESQTEMEVWHATPPSLSIESKEIQTELMNEIELTTSLLRIDCKESQTEMDMRLATPPIPRIDCKESQTEMEMWLATPPRPSIDSTGSQTMEIWLATPPTSGPSIFYALLSLFLVPVAAFFLIIWINFDRNLGLRVEYPRGPPPT